MHLIIPYSIRHPSSSSVDGHVILSTPPLPPNPNPPPPPRSPLYLPQTNKLQARGQRWGLHSVLRYKLVACASNGLTCERSKVADKTWLNWFAVTWHESHVTLLRLHNYVIAWTLSIVMCRHKVWITDYVWSHDIFNCLSGDITWIFWGTWHY